MVKKSGDSTLYHNEMEKYQCPDISDAEIKTLEANE